MRLRVIIILVCIIGGLLWLISNPIIRVLHTPNPNYGSMILRDRHGTILTNKGFSGGYMVAYEGGLSGKLFDAIITVEDIRYMTHHGVDIWGKVAGIVDNLKAGSIVRGSSTITEQYIKNAYYRGSKRTIFQKIREGIGAIAIEFTENKDVILRNYLDHIYFGNRIYGLEAALRIYYPGRIPEMLTDDEILDLITRIHTPNITRENVESARMYRASVAKKLGWNTGNDQLLNEIQFPFLDTFPLLSTRIQEDLQNSCRRNTSTIHKWILKISYTICNQKNIDLTLSVDLGLMRIATRAIDQGLHGLAEENVSNAAVYIYDPTHKKVIAYIGNRAKRTDENAIDIIKTRRSVGSILKPWIYLLALKNGAEIDHFILDDTRIYPTGIDSKSFVPVNYNPKSYGPIPLREALGNSLNSATVRLSETLSIGRIYDFLRENGLQLDHDASYYGYGIALGNVELTLENIVESYAKLIQTDDSDIFLIQKILSDPMNRAKTFGISSILNSTLNLPLKTGTSTDFRDNWIVSYHPDAIVGIWVGNANGSSMEDVSGVSGAGPIWHTIIEYMTAQGYLEQWKPNPPRHIHETTLCLDIPCNKQIHTWMKKPGSISSRSYDHLYFLTDFVGPITQEEEKKWDIKTSQKP